MAWHQNPAKLLLLALVLGVLAIGGAWFSEIALNLLPCMLCLQQRWPYYIGLPLVLAAWAAAERRGAESLMAMLALAVALVFLVSVGMGIYHAGVEWKFWLGPADCGGRIGTGPLSVDDFRKSLTTARVVLCNEAAARVLGLSFAGWNAVVSLAIAGLALRAALCAGRQGSSSESQ